MKIIKDYNNLKSGDIVEVVYNYTYKDKSWAMVKRLSDKTKHDVLISNMED